jgi:putative transposase
MARNLQSHFVQGGFYHIYNRGNRKQNIFSNEKDYKRYLSKLKEYKDKHNVTILAYCLMPNHVHFLLRQNSPEPVSTFIQKLHTAYSMYFNKKYDTVGHLFADRFKAKIVARDEYLTHLSRYIHLNPAKLVQKLTAYAWSSYPAYMGLRDDEITDTKFVLSYFKHKNDAAEDTIKAYQYFVKVEEQNLGKIRHLLFGEEYIPKPLDLALQKVQAKARHI